MSSPRVEATPPPRPPPPQKVRVSTENGASEEREERAKRRLSGDFTTGTPPMSESRRRSYSMSSRPRPFKSTPSPPHTKPKPSRPPPPSKLSAPGSKSSHPQSPSHNSPSAGAAKTTTSLPRGMKPSAILPQGGRRPYSKSIGDVHAKKVCLTEEQNSSSPPPKDALSPKVEENMVDGVTEQPTQTNGSVASSTCAVSSTGVSNGGTDLSSPAKSNGTQTLSANGHSPMPTGDLKSLDRSPRGQGSPKRSSPGSPPIKPQRMRRGMKGRNGLSSPSQSPKHARKVEQSRVAEQEKGNGNQNGQIVSPKVANGMAAHSGSNNGEAITSSKIENSNGTGPISEPDDHSPRAVQASDSSPSGSEAIAIIHPLSQSNPEPPKDKGSPSTPRKPTAPPRPYRPPRPFPPPPKDATRSNRSTHRLSPRSHDTPQTKLTPGEDAPSQHEHKGSHDHPVGSHDSTTPTKEENKNGSGVGEPEGGGEGDGRPEGRTVSPTGLYQARTLFDESKVQDEVPPPEGSLTNSRGQKMLRSVKQSFRNLRQRGGGRRHTDTAGTGEGRRRKDLEETPGDTPVKRRHTETALAEIQELEADEGDRMDPATFQRIYPDPLPQGVIHPLVILCVAYLNRESVLKETGLFRVSGDIATIRKLRADFIRGSEVDLAKVLDPHNITGLMKVHFREQRVSLIPRGQPLASIILAVKAQDVEGVCEVMSKIDVNHIATLRVVTEVLTKVVEYSEYNQMTSGTLATSTGPSLLPYLPPSNANVVLKFLIDHCSEIFK